MTGPNEEPRSPAGIRSVAPARRLPPAGFCRGHRATKTKGRVSRKMPFLPASFLAGLPRAEPRGDTFAGNENKPLRAISNRNTNERRSAATLSEPTTSQFLIATKLHVSEEKAKRE
jgi:hypothetical protein